MNDIKSTVIELLNKKIGLDVGKIPDIHWELSLLDPKIGLQPRDLLVLFFEIQSKFGITFTEDDIISQRFDYLSNIVNSVGIKMSTIQK